MKCKKCKRNMVRKQKGTVFYYECPYCGFSIGKPQPDDNNESNTDSDSPSS